MKPTYIAIFDQAIASATNFLVAIILARFLGIYEFGIYTLYFVILIFILNAHSSVFSAPMAAIVPTLVDEDKRIDYLHALNSVQCVFALMISLVVFIAAVILNAIYPFADSLISLLVFTFSILASLIAEWLRRYFYVIGKGHMALALNSVKSTLQLGCLLAFVLFDQLTMEKALFALFISSAVTFIVFALFSGDAGFRSFSMGNAFRKNWEQGRHLLPAGFFEWFNLQGFLLLGSLFLGPSMVGAVRAAQNIVGPLNILYQAVENIFPVEGARCLAKHGTKRMITYFTHVAKKGILYLLIPALLIAVSSEFLMGLLYGEAYTQYYILVILQLVSMLIGYLYKVLSSFMRVINTTRVLSFSLLFGSLVVASFTPFLSYWYDVEGLLIAKIIAEVSVVVLLFHKARSYSRKTMD